MKSWVGELIDGLRALAPARFPYARFALALPLGLLGGYIFNHFKLPLPWMLGAMSFCTIGAIARLPLAAPSVIRPPMSAAIGVMLGSGFNPSVLAHVGSWLPTLMGLVVFMILSGTSSVWYFRHVGGFDRTTGFFAGMPGGLVEMVEIGGERGGDQRVIALTHAARILLVVLALPMAVQWVSGVTLNRSGAAGVSMFAVPLQAEAWLIGCGLAGSILGHALNLPAKMLLGPMLISAVVHLTGTSDFKPPFEIVNVAQLVLGIIIGCRFVGTEPSTILRLLALSCGSTAILVFWTVGCAFVVSRFSSYDIITLVLAYAPGGLAEMSLIALALHAEVAFVAAHHIARILLVMTLAGPLFGRIAPDARVAIRPHRTDAPRLLMDAVAQPPSGGSRTR